MSKPVNKYQTHLICILLAIITFIAFEPIIHNSFISLDDDAYIYNNSHITSGLTVENIIWAFTNIHANNYHPITSLSHMLDCEIYGTNTAGHHFTNLLFHIVNTLLVFAVFSRMTKRVWPSVFIAALFALHPMHVESVAWASERKDVLSAFFWMLTMWAYLRYVKNPPTPDEIAEASSHGVNSGPGAKHYYLLTLVLFAIGLLSKPMLVTLPFVLLLLDYWPLERFSGPRQSIGGAKHLILEKIPFLVLSAVICIVTLDVQTRMGIVKSVSSYPLLWRVENALVSYIIYIWKMIWPVRLAIFYPHPQGNIPLWEVSGAAIILIITTALALWKLRQRPYFAVGWLWFLGTLVPVIGIFQVGMQGYADRYTYIPYIGLFIIVVCGVCDLSAKLQYRKIIISLSAGVLLSALTAKTYIQTMYWHDNISLYAHAVKAVENNWWGHYFLGKAFAGQKEFKEAIVQFEETLRINPQNANAYHELAKTLLDAGNVNGAVKLYRKLLPPLPDDLNEPRRIDTSRNDYPVLKAVYVNANINFGKALVRQGNFVEASRRFKEALRVSPDAEEAVKELENIEKQTTAPTNE